MRRIRFTGLTFLLASLLSFTSFSRDIDPEILRVINNQWGPSTESPLQKSLLFIPRLFYNPFYFVVLRGQLSHRIQNTGKIAVSLYQNEGEDAYAELNNSILNPLPTVSDVISNTVAILKSPLYATSRFSSRIRICTSLLSEYFFIDPMQHVEVAIDGRRYYGDRIPSGWNCEPVPIRSGEGESAVIFRINWISSNFFSFPYDNFFSYNCGGLARSILKSSGCGFPMSPNLGIGSDLGYLPKEGRESLKELQAQASEDLKYFRTVFTDLESGTPVLDGAVFLEKLPRRDFDDLNLQLAISAARGREETNRQILAEKLKNLRFLTYSERKDGQLRIKKKFRTFLKKMFVGIDDESHLWLREVSPAAAELYELL